MGQAWKPVIDGDLGDAALGAAHAIADALCEQDGPQDPSLGRGQAGIALFFSYLAQGTARARAAETATRHLERALELAAAEESGSSLYGGVAGVAWTVQHLCRHLLDEDCEPVVVPIDQALCERHDSIHTRREK